MYRIKADHAGCQGYANCVAAAPDFFDIDDDGVVALLADRVSEDKRRRVEEAARSCPVNALIVEPQ